MKNKYYIYGNNGIVSVYLGTYLTLFGDEYSIIFDNEKQAQKFINKNIDILENLKIGNVYE